MEVLLGEVIEAFEVHVFELGDPADARLDGVAGAFAAFENPFEHAHVVAEAWPEERAVLI